MSDRPDTDKILRQKGRRKGKKKQKERKKEEDMSSGIVARGLLCLGKKTKGVRNGRKEKDWV